MALSQGADIRGGADLHASGLHPAVASLAIPVSVPIGGFHCPCHGSLYDLAGRVFQNVPAPLNLPVPPHRYLSDSVIRVGEDPVGAQSSWRGPITW